MSSRNTIQKQLILQAISHRRDHPTAEQIYQAIKQAHPTVGRGTVYRNLNLLAEQGRISKLIVMDGAGRFDPNTNGHYHLHCKICCTFIDLDADYSTDLDEKIRNLYGIHIDSHQAVFMGVCPNCMQI